jgi:hypothetical protein
MERIEGEVAQAMPIPITDSNTQDSSNRLRKNVLFAHHIIIEL